MKLRNFLSENQISKTTFAHEIGVTSRMTVHRWIKGTCIPSRDLMHRITKVTDGLVRANDFYEEYN